MKGEAVSTDWHSGSRRLLPTLARFPERLLQQEHPLGKEVGPLQWRWRAIF